MGPRHSDLPNPLSAQLPLAARGGASSRAQAPVIAKPPPDIARPSAVHLPGLHPQSKHETLHRLRNQVALGVMELHGALQSEGA